MAASNFFLAKKLKERDLVEQLVKTTLEDKVGDENYDAAVNYGMDYLAASSFLETNLTEVRQDCSNLLDWLRWQTRLTQSDEIEDALKFLMLNKERKVNYDMVRFLLLMARNPASLDVSTLQIHKPVPHSLESLQHISQENYRVGGKIDTTQDEDKESKDYTYGDNNDSLSEWSEDEGGGAQQQDFSITAYQGVNQWEEWKGFVLRNGHAQWHPLSRSYDFPTCPLTFDLDAHENDAAPNNQGPAVTEIHFTLQALKALQSTSGDVFIIHQDRLIVNNSYLNQVSKPKFFGTQQCLSSLLQCFSEGGNCSMQLKRFINKINEGNKYSAIMLALSSAIQQRLYNCWEQIEQLVETVMRIKINSQQGGLQDNSGGAGCLSWALLITKPVIQQLKLLQKISSDIQKICFDNNSSTETSNLSSILNYFYDNLSRMKISGVYYENQFWFVFRIFLALLKPVIDQIQVWIENGIFHDPTGSFFMEINSFVVENAKYSYLNQNIVGVDDSQHEFWEKCCLLRLLQIPKFFKQEFSNQILHAGKAQIVLKSVEELDNNFTQQQNSDKYENFKQNNFCKQNNMCNGEFFQHQMPDQNVLFQSKVLHFQEKSQLKQRSESYKQVDEIESQDEKKQDRFFDEVLFGFEQFKQAGETEQKERQKSSKNRQQQEYIVQESEGEEEEEDSKGKYLTLQQRLKNVCGFQNWNGSNQLQDRMELIERWYSAVSSGEVVNNGELVLQNIIAANDSVLRGKAADGSIFGSKLQVEEMSCIFEDAQFSAFNALLSGELIQDNRSTDNNRGMGVYSTLNYQLGFQGMFDENCHGLAKVKHASQLCNQTPQIPNYQHYYLQQQPDIFQGINTDTIFNIMQPSPIKFSTIEELRQHDTDTDENYDQNMPLINYQTHQKMLVDKQNNVQREECQKSCGGDVSDMEVDGSFLNQQLHRSQDKCKCESVSSQEIQSGSSEENQQQQSNQISINLDQIKNDFLKNFNETQMLTDMKIEEEIPERQDCSFENRYNNFSISNAIRGICRVHPYDTHIFSQNITDDSYLLFGQQQEFTEEIEVALDQIDVQILPPFEILIQNIVIEPILKHAVQINLNFVKMMLYGQGNGILFFTSLKNSLFMQSGSIQTWASSIFNRLNSGLKVQELPQLELNVYLRSLVRQSKAEDGASLPDMDSLRCEIDNMLTQAERQDERCLLKRLICRKSTEVTGIKLVIKKIDWPVCILIQKEHLNNYNRCFHYLMAIAWTTHSVERATKQLVKFGLVCQRSRASRAKKQVEFMEVDTPHEPSQGNSQFVDNFEVPKWMFSEMRVALNFCHSLSSIVHYHMIPLQWADFMAKLESSSCIEDVIKVHGDFIRKVLSELCLAQNDAGSQQQRSSKHGDLVRKALVRGLDLCLQVSGIVTCLLNSTSVFSSNASVSKQQLIQMCQQTMQQFRDHLRYMVRLLTDVAFILEKKPLAELALKINLNEFYKI